MTGWQGNRETHLPSTRCGWSSVHAVCTHGARRCDTAAAAFASSLQEVLQSARSPCGVQATGSARSWDWDVVPTIWRGAHLLCPCEAPARWDTSSGGRRRRQLNTRGMVSNYRYGLRAQHRSRLHLTGGCCVGPRLGGLGNTPICPRMCATRSLGCAPTEIQYLPRRAPNLSAQPPPAPNTRTQWVHRARRP